VNRETRNTRIDSSEFVLYQATFKAESLNKEAAYPKYKKYQAKQCCMEEPGLQ
jgi:hypothetical protein